MSTMEDDFEGYMENLQQRQAEHVRMQDIMEQHEVWRQTTWQGWAIRQLQALGNHILPFIDAVTDAVHGRDGKHTAQQVAATIVMRALLVTAYVIALYTISWILNLALDKELVIENEVIIEHESESDIPKGAKTGGEEKRRKGRSKKDR